MSQILNKVRDVDSSNSEAVKEALTAFFQNLLKYKDLDCNRWLRALENVINRFPKYCGTHRQTIETYLTHFLSSNNFYHVIEAAKCAHAVQQVRPIQETTATAKSCWRGQMMVLCDAAHKLIDALFSKNGGMYSNRSNQKERSQVLPSSTMQEALTKIDSLADCDQAVNRATVLCTRLRNVLVFIQAMLVEIYPVAKTIQPQLILTVILQALSAPGSEDSSNVTTIKIQALRTLDALVECLGSNLIPFSALVFRFVMQTLKWSSENPSEETSVVRVSAYNSLSRWLHCLHSDRAAGEPRARAWHDELAAHIVSDLTPHKPLMQLTLNAQPMKNLSKKARKRLANTMLKESSIASHMPGQKNKNTLSDKSNNEVVVAALECAETFLVVCGIFLKTATLKQFQELLVRECFTIQDHSAERTIRLLHALEACRKSSSSKVPPPTQYCLQLYSVLINSPQREVSKFCSQALLDIRLHLHCAPNSLCFSLEEQTQKKKEKEEGRKRTSERNRVALEKLLGIDWMNSEDPKTVITIPEEPESKRPRVSTATPEITENISISSDSVHSVEMSSDSDDESIIVQDIIEEVDFEPLGNPVTGVHNEPTQGPHSDAKDTRDEPRNTQDEPQNTQDELQNTQDEPQNTQDEPQNTQDEPQNENADEPTQGMKDLAIHDEPTQVPNELDKVESKNDAEVKKIMETTEDIHTAKTQLPNTDVVDAKSPVVSQEVAYDYPNTGKDKVTVLEKMDDENLPSTNDTDDIQITCGQVVKSSQDLDVGKNKDGEIEEIKEIEAPKVNGINKIEAEAAKDGDSDKVLTVEDMLADFVDEINENFQFN